MQGIFLLRSTIIHGTEDAPFFIVFVSCWMTYPTGAGVGHGSVRDGNVEHAGLSQYRQLLLGIFREGARMVVPVEG